MPHLSPMNWIIVPVFMMLTLITTMIIMWWQFMPSFPNVKSTPSYSSMTKTWKWW